MKQRIHKVFWAWQFEKEEKWLNDMAAKGQILSDIGFCRYDFEDGEPEAYQYRLELLEKSPHHPESRDYIRFVEESGAECIGSLFRWVYFRKNAKEKPFEIFSDIDSRIRHLQRIIHLLLVLMAMEYFAGFYNLIIGIALPSSSNTGIAIPTLLLAAFLSGGVIYLAKMVERMKKEREIRE